MKRIRALLAGLTIAVIGVASGPAPVMAQTTAQSGNGFRISPVRSELTIERGASVSSTITVENPTNLPIKAKAIVNDFIASQDESGEPVLLLNGEASPSHSFKKLVGTIPDITLAPRERKEVRVVIAVAPDASAGGYYGAIRFSPAKDDSTSTLGLTASVGSIYLISVPGNLKEHLSLVQFSAASKGKPKTFMRSGDVSIITRLKNDGDIHEKPYGKIVVKSMTGSVVDQQEINNVDPKSNVLPGSIRKFETKLKPRKWLGRYMISASLGYTQGGGNLIEAKGSFWYIPTWLLITLGVVIALLLFAAYLIYRRVTYHRRRNKPHHR